MLLKIRIFLRKIWLRILNHQPIVPEFFRVLEELGINRENISELDEKAIIRIEKKLKARKDLKELIKVEKNAETRQIYEIQSELIKLMLNSCYGFTLCNVGSNKFKTLEVLKMFPLQ